MTFSRAAVEEQFSEDIHWAYLGCKYEETVNLQSSSGGIINIQK